MWPLLISYQTILGYRGCMMQPLYPSMVWSRKRPSSRRAIWQIIHCQWQVSDRYIRGIYHAERKLVLWHAHAIAMLLPPEHRGSVATTVSELADESTKNGVELSLIGVAKQTVVQPSTHSVVLVRRQRASIAIVEPIPLRASCAKLTATRREADVTPGRLFYILMKNMSKNAIHVLIHMIVA